MGVSYSDIGGSSEFICFDDGAHDAGLYDFVAAELFYDAGDEMAALPYTCYIFSLSQQLFGGVELVLYGAEYSYDWADDDYAAAGR